MLTWLSARGVPLPTTDMCYNTAAGRKEAQNCETLPFKFQLALTFPTACELLQST